MAAGCATQGRLRARLQLHTAFLPLPTSLPPQMGKLPLPAEGFNLGNNAPFQLSSFALSLLLVFRWASGGSLGQPGSGRRVHRLPCG